jgi:hypothetical protein
MTGHQLSFTSDASKEMNLFLRVGGIETQQVQAVFPPDLLTQTADGASRREHLQK